jgi:hypothetical protein
MRGRRRMAAPGIPDYAPLHPGYEEGAASTLTAQYFTSGILP